MKLALRSAAFLLTYPLISTATPSPVVPKLSVQERIYSREFPSIFEAWAPADNLKYEDRWTTLARHDLVIQSPGSIGLRWNNRFLGLADGFSPESISDGRALRARLLDLNPHLVFLAEIRYRDAPKDYLPAESPWWKRTGGVPEKGWDEGGYLKLDFANPQFVAQVAKQAHAAVASGVYDGVFLDWWRDDDERLALVQAVRAAVGEDAIIIGNVNDLPAPRTGKYLNGCYMECYRSATAKDWTRIAETLQWAEKNLRQPRVDCLETWFHQSRQDLNLMRATTTMALTMSDGYCLFCDPDPLPTPDHLHDWYAFWNKSLGKPEAAGKARSDGAWERQFDHGSAVYNPMGNGAITVIFGTPRVRRSTGEKETRFTLADCDGDLFLTDAPAPPPIPTSFEQSIRILESFVGGTWKGDMAPIGNGPALFLDMRYLPNEDGEGLRFEIGVSAGARRMPFESGMYAWNTLTGKITELATDARGGLIQADTTLDGTTILHRYTATDNTGATHEGRSRLTKTGDDSAELQSETLINGSWVSTIDVKLARQR